MNYENGSNHVLPYKSDFTKYGNPIYGNAWEKQDDGTYVIDLGINSVINTTAYIRITCQGSLADNAVITVDEEIKYTEPTTTYEWTNTGHAFIVSAEDSIGVVSKSSSISTTLSAGSWSNGNYTISNSAITDINVVELVPASNITAAQFSALASAQIVGGTQTSGSIVLRSLGTVPNVDIPVILIFRNDL